MSEGASSVTVAATQMSCCADAGVNLDKAEALVREAAGQGAEIVLLPELFETPYFCKDQLTAHFALARPRMDNPVIERFRSLAGELGVVLPFSFFERANAAYYNALVVIDTDGAVLGCYRKSHIPDGPGYQEKFYFNPGDTGFRAWHTRHATIGVGICWDQWFPEAARIMALRGAELLFYPTAIGSEPPPAPTVDSTGHWRRAMQGHAAANLMPVIASNRHGVESGESCSVTFYGHSFIADQTGDIMAEATADADAVLTATFDLEALRERRAGWGLFRDRRPELYKPILTLDGSEPKDRRHSSPEGA